MQHYVLENLHENLHENLVTMHRSQLVLQQEPGAPSGALSFFRLLATAALPLALWSCGDPPSPRFNVVLVLVDTLRSDHLSVYGYERETAPNLTAFSGQSVLFERNRAQAPCTFPSVNSLLTSQHPELFFSNTASGNLGIPEDVPTLAEILRSNGYRTAAVSASPIVRVTPSPHNDQGGFGAGFEIFREECLFAGAECVFSQSSEILDAFTAEPSAESSTEAKPFFLYSHFFDPHDPYRPSSRADRRRFAVERYHGEHDWIRLGDPNPLEQMIYSDGPELDVTDQDVQRLIDLYDGEIFHFDRYFGLLLAHLEELESPFETLVVFVSDHGESFLERGHIKHCHSLYDEEISTPLLFRLPSGESGRVVETSTNLDIVPTLLDVLGIDASPYDLLGTSLRSLIEKSPAPDRDPVGFSRWGALGASFDADFKVILDLADGSMADVTRLSEQGETSLRGSEIDLERIEALRERLAAWTRWRPEDRNVEEELRQLGYLE